MSNHYSTLGIEASSSPEEIKKAYKKLVMEHHPDKGGDEEKFKEITEAYEVLSGKRKEKQQQFSGYGFGFDFGDLFGGFRRRRQQYEKPATDDSQLKVNLSVSVEEIKQGKSFSFTYQKSKECLDCSGKGGKEVNECRYCKGLGCVQETRGDGNTMFSTVYPCKYCEGAGKSITDPCITCDAKGFTVYQENLEVDVKGKNVH